MTIRLHPDDPRVKNGRIRPGYAMNIFDELTSIETNECVEWHQKDAYGMIQEGESLVRVHVLACLRAHGNPYENRIEVAHSCGNTRCINSRHLRWATRSENLMDRVGHGTVDRGERNAGSKLTEDQVRAIREEVGNGAGINATARKYGLSGATVHRIIHRQTWGWLT